GVEFTERGDFRREPAPAAQGGGQVERGQLADGVRGQEQRTPPHSDVAVGRVQLVGTADPADRLAPRNRVAELEREVPRDAEAVGDPLAGEPPYDVIRDSRLPTHRMSPGEILLPPGIEVPLPAGDSRWPWTGRRPISRLITANSRAPERLNMR